MARAIFTGSISFGLVNIPVQLFSATAPKDVHFHLLRDKDGARIKEKRVASTDGKEVSWDHIVKGYETADGRVVQVSSDELARLAPELTHTIDIEQFVDLAEIDPIYYDNTYYVVPTKGAAKPYGLLVESMLARSKVAIARVVLRTKQKLCAIRAVPGALVLSTMLFGDEIRKPSEVGLPLRAKQTSKELALAEQLIKTLQAPFRPMELHDEYREKVLGYLHKKARGGRLALPAPASNEDVDVKTLMDSLTASLARKKRTPSTKALTKAHRRAPKRAAHA